MTSAKFRGRKREKEYVESLQNVEPRRVVAGLLAELSSLAEIGYEEEELLQEQREWQERQWEWGGAECSSVIIGGWIDEAFLIAQLHAGGAQQREKSKNL